MEKQFLELISEYILTFEYYINVGDKKTILDYGKLHCYYCSRVIS